MRLAFVCSEYPPEQHGGIGTFTRMMAQELTRRGHSVRVAGIYPGASSLEAQSFDGIEVWKVPAARQRGGWPLARLQLYRLIAAWAQEDAVDLIEAPDYGGLVALWPALKVPIVVRLHGSASYFCQEIGRRPVWRDRLLETLGLKRADFCCSVSRYTARKTVENLHHNLKVDEILYNGIESTEVTPRVRSRTRIVYTGTLAEKKGIFELAEAWPTVQREVPGAELHLFGRDGRAPNGTPSSQWLANRLAPWWGRTVVYHGFAKRAEILDALGEARAAVFPSLSEAFALAPMEAMARGCVTIYSQLSSGPELVTDGLNGLLIDPRSPADIAGALIRALTDDSLAERLSGEGRRHVHANFLADDWTDRNEQFYSRCIREFQNRRPAARVATGGHANCS